VYCNKTTLNTKNNWSGSYFVKLIRAKIKNQIRIHLPLLESSSLVKNAGQLNVGEHTYVQRTLYLYPENYILDDLRKKLPS